MIKSFFRKRFSLRIMTLLNKGKFKNSCGLGALVVIFVGHLYSPQLCADTFESPDRIKSAIDLFITNQLQQSDEEKVVVSVNQIDTLKLARCQNPLKVSFPQDNATSQANAVLVSCDGETSWNIFVPVQIQLMTSIVSVNRVVYAGEVITEDDLVYERADKNRLYDGYYKEKNDVIGLAALRAISAGSPLTKKNLKQMPVVKRNQTITLTLRKGAIEIEMIGIARSDGYVDGMIKVLNPSSKKIVDAVVTGKDRAEILY